ncbi:acyltransferase [Pseudomonas yamanorum]|uniref:acyltransferase family protein n=1 Tax=Pseudomonas yamanorum TaxID=515393 RepID=UPI0015A19835|nr:acyltransferase [Pseudomonas yamanorum]
MVKEFEFINFFRAIAALWVLVAHCMIWGGWYGIPLPSPKIAVNLFMLISGFLMMANATARKKIEPFSDSRSWYKFWIRRYFRLAPAYYLSLAVAAIAGSYFLSGYSELQKLNPAVWGGGTVYDPAKINYSIENLILHVTFLFGLHPEYSFSTFLPDWSLSLEMQFYAVFPLLFIAFSRVGIAKTSLLIGIPMIFIGGWVNSKLHYIEPSLLILRLHYFFAGMVLFAAMDRAITKKRRFCIFTCAWLLVFIGSRKEYDYFVLPGLLVLMFLLGMVEQAGRLPMSIKRAFNSKVVHFASETSYGLYLFHGFYISLSGTLISKSHALLELSPAARVGGMLIFVLASSYLTAYLVYVVVEKPGISFGKKLTRKLFIREFAAERVRS